MSTQRATLNNGITVITVENPTADIISGRLFLKAGGRWELRENAGISHLLAAVMTKGTIHLSSVEIAEKIESVGAVLGADASTDYFSVGFKTVTEDFREIFQLVGEITRSPSFPSEEVELEQYLTIQNLRSQQERPFNVAFKQLREAMYGEHPYGTSILGTEETVEKLGRDDLQHYHQTFFRPDNLVISLSGRIKHDEAIAIVTDVFGDWQIPNTPLPELIIPLVTSQPTSNKTPQDSQQAIVMLGYLTPSVRKEKDYTVLKLLNTYLGNGLSSRLFVELREKRGLAYDVSAFYPTRLDTSQFVVYMGTAPENTAIALEGLHQEVKRLGEVFLTPEDLQGAKNKLLGQYALGKQTNSEIAQMLGWYETIEVGIDFDTQFQEAIVDVTLEQALETAQRYFGGDPYISLVGPEAFIEAIN
ncbi:pitrilysin family protein [Spirulina sp. 06S082]|uniref:M16 family metallopeptidase n=1 Tax=Spirulina sp. 06S082 TaxID=3110248 RepID=UPI002B1FC88C|nr:pitrilysin family protein [Spirulina sp. 06S082]MEA5470843.1 pitrilysin family protein [Spirulina sp. 06S082]